MAHIVNPFGVYTLAEAAKILDTSKKGLSTAARNGDISARKVGYGWKFTGDNLLKFAGTPVNTGANK